MCMLTLSDCRVYSQKWYDGNIQNWIQRFNKFNQSKVKYITSPSLRSTQWLCGSLVPRPWKQNLYPRNKPAIRYVSLATLYLQQKSLLGKLYHSIACCIGHILRGQVAIITKPSPHYAPNPPFSFRDVVLAPNLLDFSPRLRNKIWEWPGDEAKDDQQGIFSSKGQTFAAVFT